MVLSGKAALANAGHSINRLIKSVHITNYYHRNSGGISTSYNKLLEAAERHQRYVRLIVPRERDSVEDINDFAKIYFIKANFSPVFDKRYRIMMPWSAYIFDQAPIKRILRDEAPDIVEIGEKYTLSLMAGLLRKGIMNVTAPRPLLLHLSCERMDDNVRSFISDRTALKKLSASYIRNYILPMFDFHLTNSVYTAGELIDAAEPHPGRFQRSFLRFMRAPQTPWAERIFVNECGVDSETFTVKRRSPEMRSKILAELGLPARTKLLLYAGRLSPEKNVRILPEIMSCLSAEADRDYRLLVAGDGPQADSLTAAFAKRGRPACLMLGNIEERARLADIFANCDVFVHPNPHEPFGIAPLEAMSAGLPVVAPNSGGLLSYANDKNAWLVHPTPTNFAAAIRDVIENTGRTSERIGNALATAKQYTWERSTDRLFALYDKLYADFSARRHLFGDVPTERD